jgi:phosphatidyl-myo-inositol dimannoside synthase
MEATHRELGKAGLAVVSLSTPGDGIAYVARLLDRVCADLTGAPPAVVELNPANTGLVTVQERLRFIGRLAAGEIRHRADWWIFNHVGIARTRPWVAPVSGRPYAVFLNGIEVWDGELGRLHKLSLTQAAVRIAISHHTAERVRLSHPELGPITSCPLGLLPSENECDGEVDRELVERMGERSVVIVGRMSASERYKGHDQLLECWARVLRRVPDARLVVVGKGDDLERLREKAGELGLGDAALFTGYVSNATRTAIMERAAIYAMPSRGEGFGLVYLQAMEVSLPCIGSRVDAAGDIIVDGETGFLVEPSDLGELSARISELLGDPEARARMGAAGKARFEREFSYPAFRDRLGAILASTFGAAGAR